MSLFIQIPHRDGVHQWRFNDAHDVQCTFGIDNYCVISEIEFLAPVRLKNGAVRWKEKFTLQADDRVEFTSDLEARSPAHLIGRITKIVRDGFGFDPKVVIEANNQTMLYSILVVDRKISE